MDPDLRPIVELAGEVGIGRPNQPDELRIELDRVDGCGAVIQREQHVGPAAGTEDQDRGPLQQVIGQRSGRVVEITERLGPAVEGGDDAEPIAIGEDAELRRRLERVVEAEPGRMAERDGRAADDGEEAERARLFAQHFGPGDEQRLAQPLVLGEPQFSPRRRHHGKRGKRAESDEGGRPSSRGIDHPDAGQRSGNKSEPGDELERQGRHDEEQGGRDAEGASPGTDQVVAVDPADMVRESGESEPNTGSAAKEWHREQEVENGNIEELPGIPDHGERVEGQTLGDREDDDGRDAEERGASSENGGDVASQPILREGEEGAAGAVAKEGNTRGGQY